MLDKSMQLFSLDDFPIFTDPPHPQFNDDTPHPRINDEAKLQRALIIEPGVRGSIIELGVWGIGKNWKIIK